MGSLFCKPDSTKNTTKTSKFTEADRDRMVTAGGRWEVTGDR